MSGTSPPPGFAAFPPARARRRPEPAATDRLPSDTMTRRAIARSSTSPQLAAGIRRVTGEVMHHGVAQRDLALRIPDRDIGVGTDLNRALARTQIVDFCRRCSGQLQTCNERVTALPFALGSDCEINTGAPIRRQFPHHPATAAILPASRSRSGGRTEPPLKPRRFIAALVVCGCPNSRASARSGYQSRCRWRRPAAFPTKPSRPFCGSDWWSAKTSLILALPSEANPTFFAVGSSRSGAVHDVRRGFHCVARVDADLRIGARHREQPPITTSRPD